MIRAALRAAFVCVVMAAPGSAATVTLTIAQAQAAVVKAFSAGDFKLTYELSSGLLQRDPNDFATLIYVAQSAQHLGLEQQARDAARRAWQVAKTPAERFRAAMVRAQVLSAAEMRTASQFWLRRAAQIAPDQTARAEAIAGLNYVRDHSHWAFEFNASVVPSSNVNGGSASDTMIILGLPFTLSGDARALSGVVASLGATATYRLTPTQTTASQFTFSGVQTHNWLSPAAQAQAPNARGSNYDYAALEMGYAQKIRFSQTDPMLYNWGATLGHNWYGGASLSTYFRLNAGVARAFGPTASARLDLSVERQLREDDTTRSAYVYTAAAGLTQLLGNKDAVRFSIGRQQTQSESTLIDHMTNFAQIGWDKAEPVLGVRLGASLTASQSDYPVYAFTVNGRHDTSYSAALTMLFSNIDYMGFSPTLTLQWTQVDSNVSLYQSRNFGVALGIKSTF